MRCVFSVSVSPDTLTPPYVWGRYGSSQSPHRAASSVRGSATLLPYPPGAARCLSMAKRRKSKPRVHSASGISLAKRCRRAWALRYVDGLKPPEVTWAEIERAERLGRPSPCQYPGQRGAALGTEVHARAELYLTKGADAVRWDDLPGVILRELIDHLPAPGSVPRENVEHEFEVELCGVVWKGLIDLYDPAGEVSVPGVWDHKTTRDILAYALLPHDAAVALAREFPAPELAFAERSIRADLQACMYVLYTSVRRALRPHETVPVRWTYTETQRVRRSLRVVDNISAGHALGVVKDAAEVAKQCDTYRSSDDAPCNTLSCDDYGGCWYRGRHCTEPRDYGALSAHRKIRAVCAE